jgi:preprotein translocase subunit YajC
MFGSVKTTKRINICIFKDNKSMKEIKNLLGSLYKGDKEGANAAFISALETKKEEALKIKKVAVAADIYNKG